MKLIFLVLFAFLFLIPAAAQEVKVGPMLPDGSWEYCKSGFPSLPLLTEEQVMGMQYTPAVYIPTCSCVCKMGCPVCCAVHEQIEAEKPERRALPSTDYPHYDHQWAESVYGKNADWWNWVPD